MRLKPNLVSAPLTLQYFITCLIFQSMPSSYWLMEAISLSARVHVLADCPLDVIITLIKRDAINRGR